ncbi:transposable element Tc1 transposase [Trichonephila clavipes]|nr:transposable element Tc1 transposase [Trichonephila clavipes]
MCPDDHQRRVWRRPGKRADAYFANASHTGHQPSVMVRRSIFPDNRIRLVVIKGTLTAQGYVDDVLRTVLQPPLLQYHGLIFQQDNTSPHTTRVAMKRHTANQTFHWSARSPDLSPIKHVWNMLGRQLHLPGNADNLIQQWRKFS